MVKDDSQRDQERQTAQDEHVNYWRNNSEEGSSWQSANDRFDAGFNKGWEDAGNGQNDEESANQAYISQYGDHPRQWQFVHGYRSGQTSRQ
ncbi:hypothetical protein [Phaffia rhodozyma]|uniref:Uncharacterized protein n=1 Tax=Phaffia rhodozyma TaxID=264483 RepID=A0A0F7SKI4_PHARH|nr:hypothetical protein [Phaffia rhodozyma]